MKLIVFSLLFYITPCMIVCMSTLQFEKETAVLHSLLDFVKWQIKEENIVDILTSARETLKFQHKIIEKFVSLNQRLRLILHVTKVLKERDGFYGQLDILVTLELHGKALNVPISDGLTPWVGSADLVFSMIAFTYMQEYNLLSPQNLAKGLKVYTNFGEKLKWKNCMEIGTFALFKDLYDISIEWLELTRRKTNHFTDIIDSLTSLAIQQHNRIGFMIYKTNRSAKKFQERATNLYTKHVSVNERGSERMSTRKFDFEKFKSGGFNLHTKLYVKTVDLCMGNTHAPFSPFQTNLKCYLETRRHPYFYINPVKTEQLAESPPIYQFYDVLSYNMIEKLKARFGPLVKPESAYLGANREERCGNHGRTRLFYEQGPKELFQLSEILSGLNIMQMWNQNFYAEYTYGRLYRVHMDHSINSSGVGGLTNNQMFEDDRCATLLYYLEVPQAGGHTPFLEAGLYAYPEKGSAILWYNMYRNGSLRYDVTHGSCPVLHGNKISTYAGYKSLFLVPQQLE